MEQQSASNESFLSTELQSKYEVAQELGKGGFGVVRRVVVKTTGRSYAMKKVLTNLPGQDKSTIKEILMIMTMCHPFVVKFVDWDMATDAVFIIMECANKGDLQQYVQNNSSSMTEEHTKYLFYQIAIAVEYLHDSKIMHRDLKPANILLHENSHGILSVKVSDFGISKVSVWTAQHTVIGTPLYMAPEVQSRQRYSNKADVWSLGVILYFMLTKGDMSYTEILRSKVPEAKNVTEQANDLLRKMLTLQYADRIESSKITEHPWICEDSKICKKIAALVLIKFLERILESRQQ